MWINVPWCHGAHTKNTSKEDEADSKFTSVTLGDLLPVVNHTGQLRADMPRPGTHFTKGEIILTMLDVCFAYFHCLRDISKPFLG
jgi:hypothetical protein